MRYRRSKSERISFDARLLGKSSNELVGMNEPNPSMLPRGKLQSYRKSDNFQLVLDKWPGAGRILSADRRVGAFEAAFDQELCPTLRKCIDHGGRARRGVVVELCFRSIDITGMEKAA